MFATSIHFHPSLIFVDKDGACQSGAPFRTPVKWQALGRVYNYRLLERENALAYYNMITISAVKFFIVQAPYKVFTVVIY